MKRVFVNSLPKSGTNLVAKCLLLFGYKECGHVGAGSILAANWRSRLRRVLWQTGVANDNGYSIGIHRPTLIRKWPIDLQLSRLKPDQFISAHVGFSDELLNSVVEREIRPLQVLRDPRAVLASFVPYVLKEKSHFLHQAFHQMQPEQRFEAALLGGQIGAFDVQSMRAYCFALSPWVNHDRTLVVQFERMVGKAGGGSDAEMNTLLQFLSSELDVPEAKIVLAAERLHGPGRHTFRKGHIDSWRSEIPAHIIELANTELAEVLDTWGYQT